MNALLFHNLVYQLIITLKKNIMRYIDIYNKLGSVQINENKTIPTWQRLKYTFRIANCSSTIQDEIYKYLETQEQPEYSITLTFIDFKTNLRKETMVSCQDIQAKMRLHPLPALLYMDWLRREPEQAASFVIMKDNLPQIPKEELQAHVAPSLLAKAEKVKAENEQTDLDKINSGE